ncbi:MAG: hypothetical protein AAB590_04015 [Patescibacteria group bacterium]
MEKEQTGDKTEKESALKQELRDFSTQITYKLWRGRVDEQELVKMRVALVALGRKIRDTGEELPEEFFNAGNSIKEKATELGISNEKLDELVEVAEEKAVNAKNQSTKTVDRIETLLNAPTGTGAGEVKAGVQAVAQSVKDVLIEKRFSTTQKIDRLLKIQNSFKVLENGKVKEVGGELVDSALDELLDEKLVDMPREVEAESPSTTPPVKKETTRLWPPEGDPFERDERRLVFTPRAKTERHFQKVADAETHRELAMAVNEASEEIQPEDLATFDEAAREKAKELEKEEVLEPEIVPDQTKAFRNKENDVVDVIEIKTEKDEEVAEPMKEILETETIIEKRERKVPPVGEVSSLVFEPITTKRMEKLREILANEGYPIPDGTSGIIEGRHKKGPVRVQFELNNEKLSIKVLQAPAGFIGRGMAESQIKEWILKAFPDQESEWEEIEVTLPIKKVNKETDTPTVTAESVDESELRKEKVGTFETLSEGQKALALENLKQVMLGLAEETGGNKLSANREKRIRERVELLSKSPSINTPGLKHVLNPLLDAHHKTFNTIAIHGAYALRGAWYGMTHGYQVRKARKEAFNELALDESKKKELLDQIAEGLKGACIDARVGSDGNVEILFAEDLKSLISKERYGDINELNFFANEFSKVPYEWSLPSATGLQRKKYERAENKYYEVLGNVKEKLKPDYPSINLRLDVINERIRTQQLISNHPELDKELSRIQSPKFWQTVAERGIYFGMGRLRSSFVAATLGTAGMPIVAVTLGAWRGLRKGKEQIRGATIESRQGKKAGEEVVKPMRADALAEGLKKFTDKFRTQLEHDGYPDRKLYQQLSVIVKNAELAVIDGRVNFGQANKRVTNQYRLLNELSFAIATLRAQDVDITTAAGIDGRFEIVESVAEKRHDKADKVQNKLILKAVLKGAAWGGAFSLLGRASRWFWPHAEAGHASPSHDTLDTGHVTTAPETFPNAISQPVPTPAHVELNMPAQNEISTTIHEGSSAWRTAKSLVQDKNEFAKAWSNPESQVIFPDGHCEHISNVNLVHEGDKLTYVAGGNGQAGHFEIRAESGLNMGIEVPKQETISIQTEHAEYPEQTIKSEPPIDSYLHGHPSGEAPPEVMTTPSGHELSAKESKFVLENDVSLKEWDKIVKGKVKIKDLLKVNSDKKYKRLAEILKKWPEFSNFKKIPKKIGKLTLEQYLKTRR